MRTKRHKHYQRIKADAIRTWLAWHWSGVIPLWTTKHEVMRWGLLQWTNARYFKLATPTAETVKGESDA